MVLVGIVIVGVCVVVVDGSVVDVVNCAGIVVLAVGRMVVDVGADKVVVCLFDCYYRRRCVSLYHFISAHFEESWQLL